MKMAISLPDVLFADAEVLAKRLKKSRSQLYGEAIHEYVARHSPDSVTAAMNKAFERIEESPDPFVAAAASRLLRNSERVLKEMSR